MFLSSEFLLKKGNKKKCGGTSGDMFLSNYITGIKYFDEISESVQNAIKVITFLQVLSASVAQDVNKLFFISATLLLLPGCKQLLKDDHQAH